jgi:two-component system, cell cycle sensor histidine kinase and response regulator CckA
MDSDIRETDRVLYELGFEIASNATFLVDADGRVLLRNRAARGLPREWLDRLFAGPSCSAEAELFFRELATQGRAQVEMGVGGRTIAVEGRASGTMSVVSVHDVTRRCELENELRTLRRLESIGHLTAALAHDFNNLLAPIASLSASLEAELPVDGSAWAMARDIQAAAKSAAALVSQTLRQVRREPTPVGPVSVNLVISELRTLIERMVGRDIDVELSLATDAGVAKVDRERLEQAIFNLAANARDAMPSGGRLTLRTAAIPFGAASEVAAPTAGDFVALCVTDTGVGMTSEVRERIFDRFFTTKERGRGTGLGLSAVRKFVYDSGGCLAVHSEVGRGTSLVLYLPSVDPPVSPGRIS